MTAHNVAHEDTAHEHELGFVRKYIFSTDHKIIGLQFLFSWHRGEIVARGGDQQHHHRHTRLAQLDHVHDRTN